jgi:hypothetical protein
MQYDEFFFLKENSKCFPVCHKIPPATVITDNYMAAFLRGGCVLSRRGPADQVSRADWNVGLPGMLE